MTETPNSQHPWSLKGPLTVKEVPGVYLDSLKWYRSRLPDRVDLAALDKTDSSALALLLEWQSWARRTDRVIEFLNPPEGLLAFAKLTDTNQLLGWA